MSTDTDERELTAPGVPELTLLGKRIEMLRLDRRLSKGALAQRAGTSRQQLWRVMTGKSELTSSLCARLSEVLEVDSRDLRTVSARTGHRHIPDAVFQRMHPMRVSHELLRGGESSSIDTSGRPFCETLEEYVAHPDGLVRTLETLPRTPDGRRMKRVLLDTIEDIAMERSLKLPATIFDLRRAIINDED